MVKKATQKKSVKASAKKTTPVHVKSLTELALATDNFTTHNLYSRHSYRLSKVTQKQLVAYGPWLATLLVAVILTELMIFAKDGNLIAISGFFNSIFFNQDSWVILLIMFTNIMLLVDGLSYLFEKKQRGWKRIYQATLISTAYITYQLFANITQPAPAIVSLLMALFALFILLDTRKYYK